MAYSALTAAPCNSSEALRIVDAAAASPADAMRFVSHPFHDTPISYVAALFSYRAGAEGAYCPLRPCDGRTKDRFYKASGSLHNLKKHLLAVHTVRHNAS